MSNFFPSTKTQYSPQNPEQILFTYFREGKNIRISDQNFLDFIIRQKTYKQYSDGVYSQLMTDLRGLFEVLEDASVVQFLIDRPKLIEPLKKAASLIKSSFQCATLPTLEVWLDQEYPDYKQLVIRIPTTDPPELAISRLREFRRKQWLGQPYEIRRDIVIRY